MKRFTIIGWFVLILTVVTVIVALDNVKEGELQETADVATATAAAPIVEPTAEPTAVPIPLEAVLDETADAANFPPNAPIVIHFNQPMDVDSAELPLSISPFKNGTFQWQDDNTTLIFTPTSGLVQRKTYNIALNDALRSESGQSLETAYSWQISATFFPQVILRSPSDNALSEWQPVIDLRFNKPMDKESLSKALHITPDLPIELNWSNDFNAAITLLAPLAFDATYRFYIDKGATDDLGIPLLTEYRWSYRLKDVIDAKTGPYGNDPEGPLTVYFNYALDASQSLDGLVLEPAMLGEWVWNEAHTAVHFAADDYYKANADYTLSFNSPLITADGVQLPPIDPIEFTTSPDVASTWPVDSGRVAPDTDIEIRFDRPMDAASTEAAFSITPDVKGEFEWEETTLHFYPEEGLLASYTDYTVSVTPSALSSDGEQVLDETYVWRFSTTYLPRTASFGYGPNAQVLDVNGRRAIQYSSTSSTATITFELYGLSLEQFLDRYESGFRGSAGWEFNPISTSGTDLVYSWTQESEGLTTEYGSAREVIVPDEVPPGLYILNLRVGGLNDQLILLLTSNTITVKQAEGQIMAWVTDINGSPVPGIEVGVYARDGRLLLRDTTDGRGVFRGRIADFEVGGPAAIEPLVVVAQDGGDITASGLTPEWRAYTGSYWYWWQPSSPIDGYSAYIYTDRPIYRPGHTVFFKAIIRADQDAVLSVPPAGTPATVRIRDARNNVVRTLEMTTNAAIRNMEFTRGRDAIIRLNLCDIS